MADGASVIIMPMPISTNGLSMIPANIRRPMLSPPNIRAARRAAKTHAPAISNHWLSAIAMRVIMGSSDTSLTANDTRSG